MVTQTTSTFPVLPEFARQPVADSGDGSGAT